MFSCEFCRISKNTFFYRTPLDAADWTTASMAAAPFRSRFKLMGFFLFWQMSFIFCLLALKVTQSLSPTKSNFCRDFDLLQVFSEKLMIFESSYQAFSLYDLMSHRTTYHHINYYKKLFNYMDCLI